MAEDFIGRNFKTGCGHFGEHEVLEIYPGDQGPGTVAVAEIAEGELKDLEVLPGKIYTVKVRCLACGHVSLMPMTFP